MKYVITGAAGNISKPLAERLLQAGHQVTVIGRNAENLKPLTHGGATAAIGSVEDVAFLTETFRGADAVYTMVPPNFGVADWKGYIESIGRNYVQAIKDSGVKHVVNLSSVGAHMPEGCGPVSGLYRVEKAFKELTDVNVLHLRPGFFFSNFYANIGMIKGMNALALNTARADDKMVMSDTSDIAEAAAEELQNLKFTGHTVRYLASDERTPKDVVKVLGAAIGKPGLPFYEASDEDTFNGMKGAGVPEEIARNYAEMGNAMRTGKMAEDFEKNRPQSFGKTKLEQFARAFAGAYNAN